VQFHFLSGRLAVCALTAALSTTTLSAALYAAPAPANPTGAAESAAVSVNPGFTRWLAEFKQDARAKGISPSILDITLADDLQPIARILELDQRQPEFVNTFWNYLDRGVDEKRLALGQEKLREHRHLLRETQAKYGIPAQILVAFWGLETHFGRVTGSFPTPAALATLAYDNRRSAFFRSELLHALTILEQKHLPPTEMKGSWAGAMGQMQFMPSTFLRYAVDANGDGRKDIWQSLPDAFHSGANYLRQSGWNSGEIWGREVRLPENFNFDDARLDLKKPVKYWANKGVRQANGKPLPIPRSVDMNGAIILPQGHAGPAFLVYRNFDVIMQWNRSINYALAVGHMADRLNGQPPLLLGRNADNRRLTRDQFMQIQQQLNQLGFDTGGIDGMPGSKTRQAIRAYQKRVGLPADGHASASFLEYLEHAAMKTTAGS
jgi:membrane-bound lytic murein transglycosylase B